MSEFKYSFSPAKRKDGLSRLRFKGCEVKINNDEKDMYEYISFTFEVMGLVKGIDEDVSIDVPCEYELDNLLGKTLAAMDFKPKLEETTGGFEQISHSDLNTSIKQFLDEKEEKGAVYQAKVCKSTDGLHKGSWKIDVETLQVSDNPEDEYEYPTIFDQLMKR